jgi:hypothetical protein
MHEPARVYYVPPDWQRRYGGPGYLRSISRQNRPEVPIRGRPKVAPVRLRDPAVWLVLPFVLWRELTAGVGWLGAS